MRVCLRCLISLNGKSLNSATGTFESLDEFVARRCIIYILGCPSVAVCIPCEFSKARLLAEHIPAPLAATETGIGCLSA